MTLSRPSRALLLLIVLTILLCTAGYYISSNSPDGLQRVAQLFGFAEKARAAGPGLLPGYQFPLAGLGVFGKAVAAFLGAAMCFAAAWGIGRFSARKDRKAEKHAPDSA